MLTFAKKYGFNVHSQNNEDGIIEECISRIMPTIHTAVEIGAPTWEYCSNTAYLADKGWDVTMYDISPNDPRVISKEITPENINQIGIPTVLSIDIDNNDYHIWKAYESHPDIVIIEINSSIKPGIHEIPGDRGASYTSMVILGMEKGYTLLCHTGNLIFILNKHQHLFPELSGQHPLMDSEKFFNKSFL